MKRRYSHLFEFRENADQGTNSLIITLLILSNMIVI